MAVGTYNQLVKPLVAGSAFKARKLTIDDLSITPPFWNAIDDYGDSIALIDEAHGDLKLSYSQLHRDVDDASSRFYTPHKRLAVLPVRNSIDCIVNYLGLLRAGHAVQLIDGRGRSHAQTANHFEPDVTFVQEGDVLIQKAHESYGERHPLHPELALVLGTSGSMNGQKFVRLSYANLRMAAAQVVHALNIGSADRSIALLPLHHVYGLSVLHSQFAAGGAVLLTQRSILDSRFWQFSRDQGTTSLAGVPWAFEIMQQAGLETTDLQSLRRITSSAGRLNPQTREWLLNAFDLRTDIIFMYGQTEACGRISVLPAALARTKYESVGRSVSPGEIRISPEGEVIYEGPNVMMGYAYGPDDLTRGDELNRELMTGDRGWLDDEGYLYLTGRRDRVCKLHGIRIDLDEIETRFWDTGEVAAVFSGDRLVLFCRQSSDLVSQKAQNLADEYRVPRSAIDVRTVFALPRSDAGKILYSHLS